MNDPRRLVGTYLLGLEPLLVSTVDAKHLVRLGGVPEELAPAWSVPEPHTSSRGARSKAPLSTLTRATRPRGVASDA